MPDQSGYARRCAEACKWCAAGKRRHAPYGDRLMGWYHVRPSEDSPYETPCTAPTIEADYERLAAENAELRRDLVSAKATIATLSNSDTVRALTQSMEDVKAGRVTRFTDDLDDAIAKEK